MQEPSGSCTVVQSPKYKFGYELSPYLYPPPAMGQRSAQSSDGADRCPQGRYRVPRSIYSVTIFTETRIIYSVADIRVPARNPRIPHAHRPLFGCQRTSGIIYPLTLYSTLFSRLIAPFSKKLSEFLKNLHFSFVDDRL